MDALDVISEQWEQAGEAVQKPNCELCGEPMFQEGFVSPEDYEKDRFVCPNCNHRQTITKEK